MGGGPDLSRKSGKFLGHLAANCEILGITGVD